mmetsp:Transcript_5492/g.20590  ORF Transcript_5492/g.20590 Transcript_5492/m.20590 type:complete len:710 (-) Transcript_5492:2500-4629(-)
MRRASPIATAQRTKISSNSLLNAHPFTSALFSYCHSCRNHNQHLFQKCVAAHWHARDSCDARFFHKDSFQVGNLMGAEQRGMKVNLDNQRRGDTFGRSAKKTDSLTAKDNLRGRHSTSATQNGTTPIPFPSFNLSSPPFHSPVFQSFYTKMDRYLYERREQHSTTTSSPEPARNKLALCLTSPLTADSLALFSLLYHYCNMRHESLWVCLIDVNLDLAGGTNEMGVMEDSDMYQGIDGNNTNSVSTARSTENAAPPSSQNQQAPSTLWMHEWLLSLNIQHSLFQLDWTFEEREKLSNATLSECKTRCKHIFEEESAKRNVNFMCHSHQLNDRIESFLSKWANGKHLKGLAGVREFTESYNMPASVKPLLDFSLKDLKQFLDKDMNWNSAELTSPHDTLGINSSLSQEMRTYIRWRWNANIVACNTHDSHISEHDFLPLLNVLQKTNSAIEHKAQQFLRRLEVNWNMRFLNMSPAHFQQFLELDAHVQMRVLISIIGFVSGRPYQWHENRLLFHISRLKERQTCTLGHALFQFTGKRCVIMKEVRSKSPVILDFRQMYTRTEAGDHLEPIKFNKERNVFIAKWDNRFEIHMHINENYFCNPEDYRHIFMRIQSWCDIKDHSVLKPLLSRSGIEGTQRRKPDVQRLVKSSDSLPCLTNQSMSCIYVPHVGLREGHIFSNVEVHPWFQVEQDEENGGGTNGGENGRSADESV